MKWRYIVVLIFFIFSFFCVIGKLCYWQIAKADELTALGQSQYARTLEILPARGDIKTSDGFPLATERVAYVVYADPKEIKDPQDMASKLSPLLKIDAATLSAKLSQDKFWVSLKSSISEKEKQTLVKAKLLDNSCHDMGNGIGCENETVRFYPEASTAAQLLGFVGKDEFGNDKGYSGLEGYYEGQLRGRPGNATIIQDARGNPILAKLNDLSTGAEDGRTLVLHIDRSIQFLVEKKLADGIQKYGAESGMAAVIDPKTGGMLAMASFPSFDPRKYQAYDESLYIDPFITATYEPGSTFKPLVMAAALNEKLITAESTCPICSGPVPIGGYDIHTWNDEYFPNTTMIDILVHSDNTGMVYVAQKLGLNKMLSYLDQYGIGQTTGIDLQGEFAPELKPKEDWYPIDLATTGFGQGISITPIELLDSFASLANNGQRMQPEIVSKIITPEGQTIPVEPKVVDQPISPETAKVMTEILVDAVNNGEAKFARLKGYRIAGKTGTASIPLNGHYDPTKTIASFIGFAPADDPKFVMIVILNKPTASIYGAETAAPIWFDIAKNILTYYGIAPTVENDK
jgi:cell division protein FtsI/penicillin-binding protein 2